MNTATGTTAQQDVTEPRRKSRDSMLWRMAKSVLPVLDAPTREEEHGGVIRYRSFTDELPWGEYDEEMEQIRFVDGKSVMAILQITPLPTEGRQLDLLKIMTARLIPLLDVVPQHTLDPWVMGIYGYMKPSIDEQFEVIKAYPHKRAMGTQYTEDFLSRYVQHYKDVTRKGGYFFDELVTGSAWGGQTQVINLCLYRNYTKTKPRMDTSIELEEVCSSIESTLNSQGFVVSRLDGKGFFNWMRDWFNPRPDICGGDASLLDEVAPYAGDDERTIGHDLAESMTLSPPYVDDKTGCWYLDGMPHVAIQMESVSRPPVPGALTGELEPEEKSGPRDTTMDRLPEGTVIAMNIIFQPREKTIREIKAVKHASLGTDEEALSAKEEAHRILTFLEGDGFRQPIFPVDMAFYIRAENITELKRHVIDSRNTLSRIGVQTFNPFDQKDICRSSNWVRNLPGSYKASIDVAAARRARLIHGLHIARLAPICGRGRGTGRPGILLFNRTGEPVMVDPLSRKDSKTNGHLFMVGTSGSGKSAMLNNIMDSMLAMHRPRVFVVDLGGSFEPLGEHARNMGMSVHSMELSMRSRISMPPFAAAIELSRSDVGLPEVDGPNSEDKPSSNGVDHSASERDILGDLEVIARQMITRGGDGAITKASHKVAIRQAILGAARKAISGELETPIPMVGDVASELELIAKGQDTDQQKIDINELASSMRLFCTSLAGHLFNRSGDGLPEVDLTIIDMATAAKGRPETLIIALLTLVMQIDSIAERDAFTGRPIVLVIDEVHVVVQYEELMLQLVTITKLWRKKNARLWMATQEVEDIPASVEQMIGNLEYWITMGLNTQQIKAVARFKALTDEQFSMLSSTKISPGLYAEGVYMQGESVTAFRSVPESLTLALSQTSPDEKEAQAVIMEQRGIDRYEAIRVVAENTRQMRISNEPRLEGREERKRLMKLRKKAAKEARRPKNDEEAVA